METLEFFAKISLVARQLGNENEFTCDQIEKLLDVRKKMKIPGKHPGCAKCSRKGTKDCKCYINETETPSSGDVQTAAVSNVDPTLINEITQKVLAALQK